ncbi:MAG: VOC family protein [Acidimicrobiia bacterium]
MRLNGSDPVLAVHDAARSAEWYRDVLGTDNTDIGGWVFCKLDAVVFRLGTCPEAIEARDLGDHRYVSYLQVDDVDAFYERAVAAGAAMPKEVRTEPWGMREFALESPDGHRFMLGQRVTD